MQCGLGWEPAQSAGMGVDMTQRAAMFEASLDLMQKLWAGEVVSEARFWNIENARISPLPAQRSKCGWVLARQPHLIARANGGWLAGVTKLDHAAATQAVKSVPTVVRGVWTQSYGCGDTQGYFHCRPCCHSPVIQTAHGQ
ncbi:MAG: hypothetical protein CM15mP120_17160 [Pseudomonadota bacterium]|nr:MAG: hypothetical protein CM15mP120_17160 [Pseudomonadota bacterium]